MADCVDPQFPRYRIPETTFDGPLVEGGDVEVKLWCRVKTVPHSAARADGLPIQLQVTDFAGPVKSHADPGPIPAALLDACEQRVAEVSARPGPVSRRDIAAAVLEEIGRRLHPSGDEAVTLVLGVAKLDVEKLTKTGDEMAAFIREFAPGEPSLRLESIAEVLATWKGQAHRDWSDLHALRRST